MHKSAKSIVTVIVVLILCAVVFVINQEYTSTKSDVQVSVVGGDRDEHGCIGSAGYSWCEPKSKCIRIWEETCYPSPEQEIQNFLAKKYDKSFDEVEIIVSKQTENHASGSVSLGQGPGEGGLFLARKDGNTWEVVFDGNGDIDCVQMRQELGFPDEILQSNFCD